MFSIRKLDMKLLLLILFLFIPYCRCSERNGSKPFYSPEMCRKQRVTDCSFHFNSTSNRCLIYNTDVCEELNVSNWNSQPLTVPALESDAPISVSICPYSFLGSELQVKPVSAINITVTVLQQGIEGVTFTMASDTVKRNLCRIFDFRNSSSVLQVPVTFFYDCLHALVELLRQDGTITFQVHPLNVELSYFMHIPPEKMNLPESVCDWRPLVMIFRGGLPKLHIATKFSRAPKDEVSFYIISLLDTANRELQSTRISHNNKTEMISSHLFASKSGYYSISISITTPDDVTCIVYKSVIFFAGKHTKDYSVLGILIAVLILTTATVVYCVWQCPIHQEEPSFKNLLFVYSYDCSEHKQFLFSFYNYMEEKYPVQIFTIYGNKKDRWTETNFEIPDTTDYLKWTENAFKKADIIVYVISEGLLRTLDNKQQIEEGHPCEDHLKKSVKIIDRVLSHEKNGEKVFCKISFSYSKNTSVPKLLKDMGELFTLPKDEDRFFRSVILGASGFRYCRPRPKLKINNRLKFQSDEKLQQDLKAMEDAVKNETHFKLRNTDEVSKSLSAFLASDDAENVPLKHYPTTFDVIPNSSKECGTEQEVAEERTHLLCSV